MRFEPDAYGSEVAGILALDGNGERLMALARPRCVSEDARVRIAAAGVPELLRAGLYLYFGCWNEAHEVAQGIHTPEGSYWHGIVHRQEPDAANASYWFRQVGQHPIFTAMGALSIEPALVPWDPFAFIEYCEDARSRPGSNQERRALELQRAEWQLLFAHCAELAGHAV